MKGLFRVFISLSLAICILFAAPVALAAENGNTKEADILKKMQTMEQAKKEPGFKVDTQALKRLEKVKKQTAGKDYVSNEVILSVANEEEARASAAFYNATLKSYSKHGLAVLQLKNSNTVVDTLEKSLNISKMYPNKILKAFENVQYTPSDPAIGSQYCHTDMNDFAAWNITKGAGVVVAVIDTGIDTSHPEFTGRISSESYNSYSKQTGIAYVNDDFGHGKVLKGTILTLRKTAAGTLIRIRV
jgi:subtilisin family serine protease